MTPKPVEECVESVLDENPEYDESRAYAICKAQQEADVEDPNVVHLEETDATAGGLDKLAANRPEWERHEGDTYVAWVGTQSGATVYQAVESQQDEMAVDILEVVQRGDDGPVDDGALLGVGVDFPMSGVYVDWNVDAWPDGEQLEEPHVSDYGTVDDLEQATGGEVSVVEMVTANAADSDSDESESLVVTGLSGEARTAIERKYDVTVTDAPDA